MQHAVVHRGVKKTKKLIQVVCEAAGHQFRDDVCCGATLDDSLWQILHVLRALLSVARQRRQRSQYSLGMFLAYLVELRAILLNLLYQGSVFLLWEIMFLPFL